MRRNWALLLNSCGIWWVSCIILVCAIKCTVDGIFFSNYGWFNNLFLFLKFMIILYKQNGWKNFFKKSLIINGNLQNRHRKLAVKDLVCRMLQTRFSFLNRHFCLRILFYPRWFLLSVFSSICTTKFALNATTNINLRSALKKMKTNVRRQE